MTRNEYPRANHADIFFLCQRFMPSTVGTTPIFTGCDTCNSTSYTLKNSDVFFSRALNNRSPLFCLLHLHWPTLNSETIAEFLIAQKSLTRVFGLGTTWLGQLDSNQQSSTKNRRFLAVFGQKTGKRVQFLTFFEFYAQLMLNYKINNITEIRGF